MEGSAVLVRTDDSSPSARTKTNKASAHDAVLERVAQRESSRTLLGKWDWIWWYDCEQMRTKKRSSRKDNLAAQATDEALAAWQV